jgi:CheY-like chemotaxis protein
MNKRRILIVDDEPAFIRLLKLNLERSGRYVVREENDSTRAYAAAVEFKPDLILLDMIMPSLHGTEVAFQIRSSELRHTPIVFLTATAFQTGELPLGKLGQCTVLGKPASIKAITEAIESNLLTPVDA